MKTRSFLVLLWLFISILAAAPAAYGQLEVPNTIAYQGYLTNTDGVPANGTASVTFRFYDDDADGAQVWREVQPNVVFTDGVFSVRLGAVESLDGVSFDRPLWLSVAVAGGGELSPRVPLEAVPYAMSLHNLRVVPGTSQIAPSPNLIGGHVGNAIANDINGATIGGGGVAGEPNVVTGEFGTVSGGLDNEAGSVATVGGGSGNVAGARATVAGGSSNTASGARSTIGGGIDNRAEAERATVAGGGSNTASGEQSTIGGGSDNEATGPWATVSGGNGNRAEGVFSNIAGGSSNRTGSGQNATIAGGISNLAEGAASAVGGGAGNLAVGEAATVPGGIENRATGRTSLAAGRKAKALHDGAFVWADRTDQDFESTQENQFLIRAQGGVGIGTNDPRGALHIGETVLGIDAGDFTKDALIVEGNAPVITLYGNFQQNTRPGLVLAGVENGNVGDKWGIVREYFGFNALHFTYGTNLDHTQNATAMSIQPDGPRADAFHATEDLGANGTPNRGGHYRDNVVYAWAEVGAAGQFVDGFGCTVERTGTGQYRLTLRQSLPNGVSVIVTPRGLGAPLLAAAVTDGSTVDVAIRRFGNGAFDLINNAFYVQVVGRP